MRVARPSRGLFWLLVAVVCATAVLSSPEFDSIDAIQRHKVAQAIWQNGDVAIGYEPSVHHQTHVPGHDGRGYALYGIGQSLVFVPLDLIGAGVAQVAASSESGRELIRRSVVALLYRLLLAPLLVLACVLLLRRLGLSRRSATTWGGAAFLCSPLMTWAFSVQEEGLAALLLILALWLALSPHLPRQPWKYGLLLGTLLGALADVRYNGVVGAMAVGLVALLRVPRANLFRLAGGTLAAASPWLALALFYNWLRFHDVLQTGYQLRMNEQTSLWSWDTLEFLRLIAGPEYGLIWYGLPVVVGLLLVARRGFMRQARGKAVVFVFVALGLGVIWLAGFLISGEGRYGGPRYLGHLLVFAVPFGMLALRGIWAHQRLKWLAVGIVALGTLVQLAGTVFPRQLEHMQTQVREYANTTPPSPNNVVAARFVNIGRMANGTLFEYSLPPEIDRADLPEPVSEDAFKAATTPHYLPIRARAGLNASKAGSRSMTIAATTFWFAALLGLIGSCWMQVNSLRKRRP
jgi:hypothetical protein